MLPELPRRVLCECVQAAISVPTPRVTIAESHSNKVLGVIHELDACSPCPRMHTPAPSPAHQATLRSRTPALAAAIAIPPAVAASSRASIDPAPRNAAAQAGRRAARSPCMLELGMGWWCGEIKTLCSFTGFELGLKFGFHCRYGHAVPLGCGCTTRHHCVMQLNLVPQWMEERRHKLLGGRPDYLQSHRYDQSQHVGACMQACIWLALVFASRASGGQLCHSDYDCSAQSASPTTLALQTMAWRQRPGTANDCQAQVRPKQHE